MGAYILTILAIILASLAANVATDLVCPNSVTVNNSHAAWWQVPQPNLVGPVYLQASHDVGHNFPLGNTTVIYTTQENGTKSNCSFIVEVVSDGSPEISNCPSDLTFSEITPGASYSPASWIEPTATNPNGGNVVVTQNYSPSDNFNVGSTEVFYRFSNSAGKTSQCEFFVRVIAMSDKTPPVITSQCPDDIYMHAPPWVTEVPVEWTEPSFYDLVDGDNLHITKSQTPGSSFTEGRTEVYYIAMDTNYNSAQCMFSVTVNITDDNIPPTITGCPNDITRWVAVGTTNISTTWTPPMATDNYGTPSLVSTAEPGSVFALGVTEVNYTATDMVGNVAMCSFTITVTVDDEAPVITGCPSDIVRYVKEGISAVTVTWAMPTVIDNSGSFTVSFSAISGQVFPASLTPRDDLVVMTFTDDLGNSNECQFTVNVLIDTRPVLNCPTMITRDNVAGEAYADVYWTEVTVTDDYTPTGLLQITTSVAEPVRVFIDDPISVQYTVTDERNNVVRCTFEIQIIDVEPPVLAGCPSNITQNLDFGTNSAIVSWTEPTATDNSRTAPTITATASNPELFYAGTYTVRYTATDTASNMDVCEFTVTIDMDSNVPVFDNCPVGSLNFEADVGLMATAVSWPTITATDDQDPSVTITSNYAPGDVLSIGSYSVEYQAEDSNGNVGYCGFMVVVADLEIPVFTSCPISQTFYVLHAARDARVTWTLPTASDNSGSVTITQTSGLPPGSQFFVGVNSIAYRAMDAYGNFADCSFTIDVLVKADTTSVNGKLSLDQVRGLNGIFGGTSRQNNLRDDLDDLFRGTDMAQDFVGIEIASRSFDNNDNFLIDFDMYLCATSHYNGEDIKAFFYGALTGSTMDSFATSNVIVPDSFTLDVAEFRGQFTLRSILSPGTVPVDFQTCCSDPTSNSYNNLINRIYDYFDMTYGTDTSFRLSKVLLLSAGSVVVDYTLTFDGVNSPAAMTLEDMFNNTVASSNRELVAGADTSLYLAVNGYQAGSIQEICPENYCLNGGTCVVSDQTMYTVECNCLARYYGDQCQHAGLHLEVIIAIGIGAAIGFLLIIFVVLCCCLCSLSAQQSAESQIEKKRLRNLKKKRRKEREYLAQTYPFQTLPSPVPPPPVWNADLGQKNGGFVLEMVEQPQKSFIGRQKSHFDHKETHGGAFSHKVINEVQQNGLAFGHVDALQNGHVRTKNRHEPDPLMDQEDRGQTKRRKKGPRFGHDEIPPLPSPRDTKPRIKNCDRGSTFHDYLEPEPVGQINQDEFNY